MIQRKIEKRRPENSELRKTIDTILNDGSSFLDKHLKKLNISTYKYDINIAVEELGFEEELVHHLVEDYIIQILKSKLSFCNYIEELKQSKLDGKTLDFENIRNLAHKNLGVARNLRIEDAQILLTILLKDDDLDYMKNCAKALEISAVKLNPLCAYETLNLIKIKNSL